jgi:segregation and condensation protein A
MAFRANSELYRGPMDLLLYLVRKHEVEIRDLPIAPITQQYLEYIAVLEQLDVNAVGDFIEIASSLIEIKSRSVLPVVEPEDERYADPREQLVARLLEYKKYKDVASMLEERSLDWQQSFGRMANDLPPRQVDPVKQPIREVELWDLVSALGRVLKEDNVQEDTSIVYDDVPIQTHMKTIYDRICQDGRIGITQTLRAGMRKSTVIGIFLAVLELVRHHSVEAEQEDAQGEIWVKPGPKFSSMLELAELGRQDPIASQTQMRSRTG